MLFRAFERSGAETAGSLSKLRRQRQRERRQTKGLISRTIALQVRLKSWHISKTIKSIFQQQLNKTFHNREWDNFRSLLIHEHSYPYYLATLEVSRLRDLVQKGSCDI